MELKFIFRNLKKRPFLNLIRIVGLSLALSCILLIVLFLKNELTFDNWHKTSDSIYRFTITNPTFLQGKHFARVYNSSYIPAMADYFPEIENYVRLAPVRGGFMKHDQDFFELRQGFLCDSTFFEVFAAELLTGNSNNILDEPSSIIISQTFAAKIFGKANPVGEILTIPSGQFYDKNMEFTVKGVMKDFPQNSHFHPEFIATPADKSFLGDWAWVYLLLTENADPEKISSGFKNFYSERVSKGEEAETPEPHLQNICDIHLHSAKLREIEPNRDMVVIFTFTVAAIILLLIALANYANLTIGMAYFSDKYLFISKVSGSSVRTNLIYFISEGVIIALISVCIGVFVAMIANTLIIRSFGINLFTGSTPLVILVLLLFAFLVICSGMLPLLKKAASAIKLHIGYNDGDKTGKRGMSKAIIVLQYTISVALIAAVLVIQNQTSFAMKSSMGSENENLICFEDVSFDIQQKFGVFKEELLKYNSIETVSAMMEPPGGEANDMFRFTLEGYTPDAEKPEESMIGVFPCDYSFASIFDLKFLSGDNFSQNNNDSEGAGEYIINRAALKKLNYTNPEEIIGKSFKLIFDFGGNITIPSGKITGVVEDFHLSGIKKEVEPLVMFKRKDLWLMNLIVSMKPGMQQESLADIKNVWTKIYPQYPFQYQYVNALYESVYRTEILQVRLLSIFTVIALFICSMGLLGLSLLTTQSRTKEIGIRKINGATMGEILVMLNCDLLKWIVISIIPAIPLAYFLMDKWLEAFAYRVSLSWWIFALASLAALIIAFITISAQSWKAASRNPVEALRYE